jgi:hypothetical protein
MLLRTKAVSFFEGRIYSTGRIGFQGGQLSRAAMQQFRANSEANRLIFQAAAVREA